MKHLVALLLLASSCSARTFDCGVVDIEVTRQLVGDEWPDVLEVFDRMDFFCKDDTDTFQTCGRAGYEHTEACTAWPGAWPYRGRAYLNLSDEDFEDLVMHEAQHWHLMLANGDDGCPTHEAECGWKD